MKKARVDSIMGCIVGGAIGDGAGASFEGTNNLSTTTGWLQAEWRLTDDTQFTLATCEALALHGTPDPAVLASSFLRWYKARRFTGMGASTMRALRDLDAGAHWSIAGRGGERAAGNGAAMRIAPLAFCVDPSSEEGRGVIRDVCRITHRSEEAYVGALAVVLAIGGLPLDAITSCLPDTLIRDRLAAYAALPPQVSIRDAARRYGTSGYVVESVPFALFAARRLTELGFAGMLEQVIAAGGDTDTNGSLAGQVAGAALGIAGLPSDLIERLPQADLVLEIAQSFSARMTQ